MRMLQVALVMFLALMTAAAQQPTLPEQDEDAVWQILRDGGVALIRHARAPGTGDPVFFDINDCSTQRNLSQEGRDQARELGQAFEAASVTVGKVLHSRWCRARDTAELAFPGKVEPEPVLDSFFADRATREEQTEQLRRIVSQWSGPDALVLVTHQVNITALTDVFPREGEVIVLKPGDDGFDIAGRIAPVPAK
ncbi:MAG: histidine phosphatase family protein [Rhodobiaceae bacterium]|nr:histidine phosphatase family protein [Rhodobiaceae bacterium]MCC0047615.1 histidine phosphatase family protein [Rhodobiaceae bacterium]